VNGQRGITADTALRLGQYFGTTAEFWMNVQAVYELDKAKRRDPGSKSTQKSRAS
jgi:antitoxin HigA-1